MEEMSKTAAVEGKFHSKGLYGVGDRQLFERAAKATGVKNLVIADMNETDKNFIWPNVKDPENHFVMYFKGELGKDTTYGKFWDKVKELEDQETKPK